MTTYETNNPLGTHAGLKKLGAVYISFTPCLPPEFSSSLNNIFLALLFNSLDRKQFGTKMTFKQLISDINSLENEGINLLIDNKSQIVYFSLGLIIGDNLGLHSILGFSESFMANYPCRFCKCLKNECNFQTLQDNNKLRNKKNYNSDININNISLTGIKEICVWNQISSFYVTHNYSVDIMYDVLEGVCNYDLAPLLNNFILNFKYFSLNTFNNRIQYFNYGRIENQNRAPLLLVDFLKTNQIKMSATEMLCFTRHLGLMIGDLVPKILNFGQFT